MASIIFPTAILAQDTCHFKYSTAKDGRTQNLRRKCPSTLATRVSSMYGHRSLKKRQKNKKIGSSTTIFHIMLSKSSLPRFDIRSRCDYCPISSANGTDRVFQYHWETLRKLLVSQPSTMKWKWFYKWCNLMFMGCTTILQEFERSDRKSTRLNSSH